MGRILALGDRRLRVAVDGRTAAGKTTLGHELARSLAESGRVVLRASLDDFKRPWAEAGRLGYDRTSGEGYYRNAFDLGAIRDLLLAPARPAGSGRVALCSIDPITQIDHSAEQVTLPHDGILLVDGVFALRPELTHHHWDLRIWVDIEPDLSLRRGLQRDTDQAERVHRERYGPAEAIYIDEVDPAGRADIVVDNTRIDDPRIVRDGDRPGP